MRFKRVRNQGCWGAGAPPLGSWRTATGVLAMGPSASRTAGAAASSLRQPWRRLHATALPNRLISIVPELPHGYPAFHDPTLYPEPPAGPALSALLAPQQVQVCCQSHA